MSKYTTGELAKLCEVSVRTVQYYDSRQILVPAELTDGGRRLYSESDLRKLKLICFLRGIGLSIDNIAQILTECNSTDVVALLLEEQSQILKDEITSRKDKLRKVEQLTQELKSFEVFSVETIGDIAFTMEKNLKLKRVHTAMVAMGIVMDIIEVATVCLWAIKGIWLPFAIGLPIVIALGIFMTRLYYKRTAYICPQCHSMFKPRLKNFLFSAHTYKTRRLTCPDCAHTGFCVETYDEREVK